MAPLANAYPGTPPRLRHRTRFDDGEALDDLRGKREIVKGRFQKGRVAYISVADLELYCSAFRKSLNELNDIKQRVLDVVQEIGPVNGDQIKEEVALDGGEPLLKKQIIPALHRMQEACIVFEDQAETDWDRGWCDLTAEWSEVDLARRSWERAAGEVVKRFLKVMVFATFKQVKDWSCWSVSKTKRLMAQLEAEGDVIVCSVDGMGARGIRLRQGD